MPRRPDPETGLIPVEAEPPMHTIMHDEVAAYDPSALMSNTTGRSRLEQLVTSYNMRYPSTQVPPAAPPMVYADAERDISRGTVALRLRQQDRYTDNVAVIENVTWRAVLPGEAVAAHPFMLDERAARILAEQLGEFHPEMRRLRNAREQLEHSQNEVRSLMNQLEEVRNHNSTLLRVNEEQQRQVRWLERELRDANQERRNPSA